MIRIELFSAHSLRDTSIKRQVVTQPVFHLLLDISVEFAEEMVALIKVSIISELIHKLTKFGGKVVDSLPIALASFCELAVSFSEPVVCVKYRVRNKLLESYPVGGIDSM